MKKTLLIMVMALAVLFTQCRKPEVKFPSPVAPEGTTVSMTVTAGPGSKTDIIPAGGITWSTGDKLYVGDGSKYVGYLTITSGVGTPTGTFSGDVTLTGIMEGTPHTFGFYYLGSAERTLAVGATSAVVDFSSQEIYNNGDNLENASAQHVGYGSASGTVKDGIVTGINVTLVSKVALARFSFTEAAGKGEYSGPLALSGTGICNKMTVSFASSTGFSFTGTEGTIRLRGSHSERYVMLVPAGTDSKTLNFVGGAKGTTILENGIESNKFYGREVAIGVEVTPQEYVDLGLSVKWATCNLGASKPEEYGDYYAWGEILPYYADGHSQDEDCSTWRDMTTGAGNTDITNGYAWGTYSQDGSYDFAEWTTPPYDATTKILKSDYDAAHANWGDPWRMPTTAEWQELIENTIMRWVYDYDLTGVPGFIVYKVQDPADKGLYMVDIKGDPEEPEWVTYDGSGKPVDPHGAYSTSDVHIFLPAGGGRWMYGIPGAGVYGTYWASALTGSEEPDEGEAAAYLRMEYWYRAEGWCYRYIGQPVRAVCVRE